MLPWVPAAISAGASLLGMRQAANENAEGYAQSASAATTAYKREGKQYKRNRKDFLKDDKRNRGRYIRDIRRGPSRQRAAAERAGFNPLSVMGNAPQGGQASMLSTGGGITSGGFAPLSSANMLTDAVTSVGKIFTGEAAREQSNLQLQNDLARLELEKLNALSVVPKMEYGSNGGMPTGPSTSQNYLPTKLDMAGDERPVDITPEEETGTSRIITTDLGPVRTVMPGLFESEIGEMLVDGHTGFQLADQYLTHNFPRFFSTTEQVEANREKHRKMMEGRRSTLPFHGKLYGGPLFTRPTR